MLAPQTPAELAEALGHGSRHGRTITLTGHCSKRLMAGPAPDGEMKVSSVAMRRVLQYEPRDLTISVEAGLPWRELVRITAENGLMVPLDPPFGKVATVGGVVAANSSGPRRLQYGTARDLIIGMQFATLEGRLAQSGGMVVKNVAGLDMAKLMIGSFGTLAAIAVVNFKLAPAPETERSFLLPFASERDAVAARDRILRSAIRPAALDLLDPHCGATLGKPAWQLAVRAAGNAAAVARCERELGEIAEGAVFEGADQRTLWEHIENFTPWFLERHPDGAVVRVSCTLKDLEDVMAALHGPALARAGSGVCYGCFEQFDEAAHWTADAVARGWKAVIEFAPEERKHSFELWPRPGSDFEIMRRIKKLFDPSNLLNRGRLYGRL